MKNGETEPITWKEMKANIKETSDKVLGKHKFEPTKSCHRSKGIFFFFFFSWD